MAKKASSRRLGDLVKRARPETSEETKGGKTKFTLSPHGAVRSASARAKARRSRPD